MIPSMFSDYIDNALIQEIMDSSVLFISGNSGILFCIWWQCEKSLQRLVQG